MNTMKIENAKYTVGAEGDKNGIKSTIDGVPRHVPLDPANRHYAEIQRQVAAGDLTIADADD